MLMVLGSWEVTVQIHPPRTASEINGHSSPINGVGPSYHTHNHGLDRGYVSLILLKVVKKVLLEVLGRYW